MREIGENNLSVSKQVEDLCFRILNQTDDGDPSQDAWKDIVIKAKNMSELAAGQVAVAQ